MLLELEQLGGELDVWLQEILGILTVRAGVACVLLDVQTDGGATASSSRETDDDTTAISELDEDTLVPLERADVTECTL